MISKLREPLLPRCFLPSFGASHPTSETMLTMRGEQVVDCFWYLLPPFPHWAMEIWWSLINDLITIDALRRMKYHWGVGAWLSGISFHLLLHMHLVVFTLSVVVLPSLFSICLTVSFNVPPASQLIALFLTNSQTHASSSRRYETV